MRSYSNLFNGPSITSSNGNSSAAPAKNQTAYFEAPFIVARYCSCLELMAIQTHTHRRYFSNIVVGFHLPRFYYQSKSSLRLMHSPFRQYFMSCFIYRQKRSFAGLTIYEIEFLYSTQKQPISSYAY